MSLIEKEAYVEMLEEKVRKTIAAIAHFNHCVRIELAATSALNQFRERYSYATIHNDPLLQEEESRLVKAKTKAWNDRFAAEGAAYPPTLERVLGSVAMAGYTEEVAPLMNLTKETRICKLLQPVMREVRNKKGKTQLWYFSRKGMTASVVRMLGMKSIDVEGRKEGGFEDEWTCLMAAANNGHLDICLLLIDKGAQLEAKDGDGWTPLHCAAYRGHIEIVRLLCDHGADVEARDRWGKRPLHEAVWYGHFSVVKELIEERNANVNARTDGGTTALSWARHRSDIAAYLISHGGIE
jgi:hypothetical protein